MKAREVFRDCEYTKERLQEAIDQNTIQDAKVFWFAAVAMLRTIGYVLYNVDAKMRGSKFRTALKQSFELWQEEQMFKDFIDFERHDIVKEYKSSLSEQTSTEDDFLLLASGGRLLLVDGGAFMIGTSTITKLIKERGAYSGESPVDVISKALAWWDKELSELEKIS